MKYIIGADIGTSGTKSVLYDEKLNIIEEASCEYPLFCPNNGWAEQNPQDWSNALLQSIKQLASANLGKEIVGLGLSGQMHGLVLLDKSNNVLMNSIIWCDTRASLECEEILRIMPDYAKYTLNPPIVGFTLPKLLWVKNNNPQIYKQINKILLPKDYVNFCLTGKFSTDVSDASGTGYFDVANRCWSKEVLQAFDIKEEWLPKVFESQQTLGKIMPHICKQLGLIGEISVVAGAGDQAAAGLGNLIFDSGQYSISLGSSGVVFTATDRPLQDKGGRVHTFCHAIPNMWHVMGVTQGAGLSVKWFKENFAKHLSYKELDSNVKNLPIGSNGVLFLPYLNGERTPHLDSNIRGAFIGLSARNNIFDMYRAVLEGVSYSLKNCLDIMLHMNIQIKDIIVCGGGAKSPIWIEILSNCLGNNIYISQNSEAGTKGVAMLAMIGSGIYSNIEMLSQQISNINKNKVLCNNDKIKTYKDFYLLFNDLYMLLKDHNKKLMQQLSKL